MSNSPSQKLFQLDLERRFNCMICLTPKLRMVYGCCQHRICEQCLYTDNGDRRPGMEKCPCCQKQEAYPAFRPDIPEDNIANQEKLGICKCINKGCGVDLWSWEVPEHQIYCNKQSSQNSDKNKSPGKHDSSKYPSTKNPRRGRSASFLTSRQRRTLGNASHSPAHYRRSPRTSTNLSYSQYF